MPFQPGKPRPANAGRRAGTPNKATQTKEQAVAETGLTPLEILLRIARGQNIDSQDPGLPGSVPYEIGVRRDCARDAAPYVHRKMPKEVEVAGKDGAAVPILNINLTTGDPSKPEG